MVRPSNYWELVEKYYPNYFNSAEITLNNLYASVLDGVELNEADKALFDSLGISAENLTARYEESCDAIYRITVYHMVNKLITPVLDGVIDPFAISKMLET